MCHNSKPQLKYLKIFASTVYVQIKFLTSELITNIYFYF